MLVGGSSTLPLDHLGTALSFFLGDVKEETVEQALDGDSFSLLDKSPSLVPSLVFLPLAESFAFLSCGPGHIKSLSTHVVNNNCATLDGGVINLFKSEQLAFAVGIVWAIPKDTL